MEPGFYSVSFRLQRTTTEYGYVLVPITPEMLKDDGRLDAEKLGRAAIEKGHMASAVWYPEGQNIDLHPLQKAPDPGEQRV